MKHDWRLGAQAVPAWRRGIYGSMTAVRAIFALCAISIAATNAFAVAPGNKHAVFAYLKNAAGLGPCSATQSNGPRQMLDAKGWGWNQSSFLEVTAIDNDPVINLPLLIFAANNAGALSISTHGWGNFTTPPSDEVAFAAEWYTDLSSAVSAHADYEAANGLHQYGSDNSEIIVGGHYKTRSHLKNTVVAG